MLDSAFSRNALLFGKQGSLRLASCVDVLLGDGREYPEDVLLRRREWAGFLVDDA